MKPIWRGLLLGLALSTACRTSFAAANPAWTTPVPPFRIADNLFYVGSQDLAAFLITTSAGDILINENLTSSPPLLQHSIEALGFHLSDVKILLASHAHSDHIAGAAALKRLTHAQFALMDADVATAESGGARDFAFPRDRYPAVHVDRMLHDGEPITLGGTILIAHKTAGHTPGTTTFTLQVHVPGEPATSRRNVVIVGSWSVLSEYRLIATPGRPASYPTIASDFEHTFRLLAATPCDIFLAAHGSIFNMLAKLPAARSNPAVWIDPAGYHAALAAAKARFEYALQQQTAQARATRP